MPNVLSSGTIGTTRLPICLSRSSVVRIRTNAIVVEIVRAPVGLSWASNADSSGTGRVSPTRPPDGQRPAQRRAPLPQVGLLRAALLERQERQLRDLLVGQVDDVEAVAERAQHVLAHLLLLVGDVLASPASPIP